jgi:hypothetical protein
MLFGPSACPAKSKVGTNDVTIDSGVSGSGRYSHEDVTFFNEPGGLIVVSHDRASGAYVVLHGRIKGGSFDLDQPPLPGTPPDGGATKSEHGTFFRAIGSGGRSYITTPRTCPSSRIWRFHYRYTFSDGREQAVTSDQRCQRRPRHRLRIRVRGVPSNCVKSPFIARVRVSGGAAVRRVRILVDGRSVAKRRARRFDQRIDASALPPGRHRLTARVRDHAGDTATVTVPFRRC